MPTQYPGKAMLGPDGLPELGTSLTAAEALRRVTAGTFDGLTVDDGPTREFYYRGIRIASNVLGVAVKTAGEPSVRYRLVDKEDLPRVKEGIPAEQYEVLHWAIALYNRGVDRRETYPDCCIEAARLSKISVDGHRPCMCGKHVVRVKCAKLIGVMELNA